MNSGIALSIGDVARKTGLTERALRLYEAEGLLAPARTEAGRRFYTNPDLFQLQQIQILRRAGYSLSRIRTILGARNLDTVDVIDMHLEALKEEKDNLQRAIDALESARSHVEDGASVDGETLCDMIRIGECLVAQKNWKEVFSRYWTEEEISRIEDAKKRAFGDDASEEREQEAIAVIRQLEKLMTQGEKPDSPRSIELVRQLVEMQRPVLDAVPELFARGAQMVREMTDWSELAQPFSKDLLVFMKATAEAGRAKDLIPPSKFKNDNQDKHDRPTATTPDGA